MIHEIRNGFLTARVSSKGAELQSLFSRADGREYLWQGAPEAWSGHSLLLFPAAGRIDRSRVLIRGREYPLPMHGFLKDLEFRCLQAGGSSLTLEASDTGETRRSYPFPFRFRVDFSLDGDVLTQRFSIVNSGTERMSFGFGAHPGFFCPIVLGETAEDDSLEFDRPQTLRKIVLEPYTRLCTQAREPFLDHASEIPLSETFFDAGPIVAEGCSAGWIQLRSKKSGIRIRMSIEGFPYLTLWGAAHRMSLICMEPWCGLSDFAGTDHVWENKPGSQSLAPGETFVRELRFQPGKDG